MPRFYYQEQAAVYAPQDATVQAVARTLTEMGGKPIVSAARVTCKLGWWLRTRVVGGAFVPARWLPVEAIVDVVDMGDHREVVVSVAERVGFGLLLGMESRLRQHCQQTARYLRDTTVYRLTTGS
jgi:hypothetical protein